MPLQFKSKMRSPGNLNIRYYVESLETSYDGKAGNTLSNLLCLHFSCDLVDGCT
jgi:hypothetical protein